LCGDINSCSLKVAGCGSAYSTGNLVIDATTGEVTAKKNVDLGYEDTVCVSCMNSASSLIEFDNWKVTQKPNCETLTANSLTNKEFPYDVSQTSTTVYTSAQAFANSKGSACPITSCTVKQQDCSTALVAPFDSLLSVDVNNKLKISQTQASGYPDKAVCYACTNYKHTVTI
jgi:hypothetical protein